MARNGEISVEDFCIGMSVQITYVTPDSGRPTMNLEDRHGNVILHVNPRWEQRVLVLNTKGKGGWGHEERPSGFDFSCGVPITIRCEAAGDHFNILVNGSVIHCYKHRVPVDEVKKVTFNHANAENATKHAQLISLSIFY